MKTVLAIYIVLASISIIYVVIGLFESHFKKDIIMKHPKYLIGIASCWMLTFIFLIISAIKGLIIVL